MPKLWFLSGTGAASQPLLEIPPDVDGLKDWIEARIGLRPGWPSVIRTDYSRTGDIELELKLTFMLRTVDEVTALTLVAKAEMNK